MMDDDRVQVDYNSKSVEEGAPKNVRVLNPMKNLKEGSTTSFISHQQPGAFTSFDSQGSKGTNISF